MKQRSLLATLLIAGFLSALPGLVQAQDFSRDNGRNEHLSGNSGHKPGHNKGAPFDTGIGILIAAGAAYGLKKAYDKRKKDALTR